MFAWDHPGPVDLLGQRLVKNFVDQGTFPRAGNPGDAGHDSQGDIHVYIFQVVFRRPPDGQETCGLPPFRGHGNFFPAGQIVSGDGARGVHNILRRPLCHHLAPVLPGAGADIHNIVRRPHSVLIVFHHDHAVAQVPQVDQGPEQLVVVPLVQANAGLIQNVGYPHQAGTDLGGQADPLGLPAGQGPCCPGQGQIVQPHIHQESQPGLDLLQNRGADGPLHLRQLQMFQIILNLGQGHGGQLIDIFVPHRHRQGGGLQPLPMAGGAGGHPHKGLVLCFQGVLAGLPVAALQVLEQPVKGHLIGVQPPLSLVGHRYLLPICAVFNDMLHLRRIVPVGSVQTETIPVCQRLEQGMGVAARRTGGSPAVGRDGTLQNAQALVRNDQIHIVFHFVPQAIAVGAGAKGIVEGKAPGFHRLHADAAVRAGKALAEMEHLPPDHIHHGHAVGEMQGRFHGIGEPFFNARPHHQPVHHNLYVVLPVFFYGDLL